MTIDEHQRAAEHRVAVQKLKHLVEQLDRTSPADAHEILRLAVLVTCQLTKLTKERK